MSLVLQHVEYLQKSFKKSQPDRRWYQAEI